MVYMLASDFAKKYPIDGAKLYNDRWYAVLLDNGYMVSIVYIDTGDNDNSELNHCLDVCVDYFRSLNIDDDGDVLSNSDYDNREWLTCDTVEETFEMFNKFINIYKNAPDYGKEIRNGLH